MEKHLYNHVHGLIKNGQDHIILYNCLEMENITLLRSACFKRKKKEKRNSNAKLCNYILQHKGKMYAFISHNIMIHFCVWHAQSLFIKIFLNGIVIKKVHERATFFIKYRLL